MHEALGLIAVASTGTFAFTCLALSALDYNVLEASDVRAFEFAAAVGSDTTHLVSTGVVRGYLAALSLLAASAVASTGALVVESNRCFRLIARLLERIIASLAFIALIFGIILLGLAASAQAASEMPNWCAPRSATRATTSFLDVFAFAGDPATFDGVPLSYVYDEENGATRPLSGSESSNPGGGGVGLGGEFTGSGRVVDAQGQLCFAVNTGMASYWRDALARAALPSALGLILLLVAYFALLNEDTSAWDEIQDLCCPTAPTGSIAEKERMAKIVKENLSCRDILMHLPKGAHGYHPVACGLPLAPYLEQAGLSVGGVNIVLRAGAASTATPTNDTLPPPSISESSSSVLRIDSSTGNNSISSSNSSSISSNNSGGSSSGSRIQAEGRNKSRHHSVALVEDLALDERLTLWYESVAVVDKKTHLPATSSAYSLVILEKLAVAWPALASLTASDAASLLVAFETARELHRWLGLRNLRFQKRDIVHGTQLRNLALQAAKPVISKEDAKSMSERTAGSKMPEEPPAVSATRVAAATTAEELAAASSAEIDAFGRTNSEEEKSQSATLYSPAKNRQVSFDERCDHNEASSNNRLDAKDLSRGLSTLGNGSSTSSSSSSGSSTSDSTAHSTRQTTGSADEELPTVPPKTVKSTSESQYPALPPRTTTSPRPQPPPFTGGIIPEAWSPPSSPFLRSPPLPLPGETPNNPHTDPAAVRTTAILLTQPISGAAFAKPPSTPTTSARPTPTTATANSSAAPAAPSAVPPFLASPVDRSAATYYAVRVAAGGKKSCRVAWTPPPADPRFFADTGGERRFSVVSKAPALLRVGKPEVLTCPAAAADPQRPKPLDVRFSVLGPDTAPAGGCVLEALAEVYEHRPGGGRAAVDLLEFTIQVMAGHET